MKCFQLSVALLLLAVGMAALPSTVEARRAVKLLASKDSTLYRGLRDYCRFAPAGACTPDLFAYCPWCNHGKDRQLSLERQYATSDAIVAFTLKKVSPKNIKSCKISFPKPAHDPVSGTSYAEVKLTDVSFKWREKLITYATKPNATAVGSYGLFNPYARKAVDVTKGCKYALKNRTASGNGLAISLELVDAPQNWLYYFPSREAGSPATLTITYK